MKFCPQCGTSFEPESRFCLECGFDRLTVDMEVTPKEAEVPLPEKQPLCPECGASLLPGDRFCLQCGFDTLQVRPVEQVVPEPIPSPIIHETARPTAPVEESQPKNFCPQCGAVIAKEDRFCPECGFDSGLVQKEPELRFQPVEQPEQIHKTEYTPPIVEKVTSPKPQATIPPPAPQAIRTAPKANAPPVKKADSAAEPKSIKPWLWIPLLLIGLAVIGTAGWYGYKKYVNEPVVTSSDTIENTVAPTIPDVSATTINNEATEPLTETTPAQPNESTKPLSRIDQELAKQKAKQQNNPAAKPNTSTAPAPKPDLGVKVSSNTAVNDQKTEVLLEVGRKEDAKSKNPKNPTKLSIHNPTMIVRITTDHYNGGMGTSGGGTISIKDEAGNIIGSFKAYGKSGKDGAPDAKWVAEPRKVLEKGTYYIWDSDKSTWSKNFLGVGFVVVEGYEVE